MLANSVDADKMPRSAASDLGLHCLPKSQKCSPPGIYVLIKGEGWCPGGILEAVRKG